MPTYTYFCPVGHRQESLRRIEARDNCPPCRCGAATERRITPTMIASFTPYQAVAVDKETGERPVIRSKGEHEAFLRRNGYEEVGNDKSMAPLSPAAHKARQATKQQEAEEEAKQPVFDMYELGQV